MKASLFYFFFQRIESSRGWRASQQGKGGRGVGKIVLKESSSRCGPSSGGTTSISRRRTLLCSCFSPCKLLLLLVGAGGARQRVGPISSRIAPRTCTILNQLLLFHAHATASCASLPSKKLLLNRVSPPCAHRCYEIVFASARSPCLPIPSLKLVERLKTKPVNNKKAFSRRKRICGGFVGGFAQ